MFVTVTLPNSKTFITMPQEMAALTSKIFPVANRVPEAIGEAFDLLDWYSAIGQPSAEMTHMIVRAADEFQVVIPREQLTNALLQYSIAGSPLAKGGPLRLYVPDGSSACLNVKSVVSLQFVVDPNLGDAASYGFRNEVTEIKVIKGKKSV